jgi:xylose dehydrogenase (NAD/NADP)
MSSPAPVRLGILGTGRINDQLLAGARLTQSVRPVAVGSRDLVRAREFAARHGLERVHGSYEDLLTDPGVDAVYVPLPNSLHHPWAMKALRAGKHVLAEKPYTAEPREVDEAFELADRSGLVLVEAFMWRHGPGARLIRELLPTVGEVVTIWTAFSFVLEWEPDVRLGAELAGGSLMDVGCYSISGARFAAGEEPNRVFGVAAWGPSGVDRRFHGQLEFPGGAVAQISSGFDTDHRGIEVSGTQGSFSLSDPWRNETRRLVVNDTVSEYADENQYRLELDDLAAAIRGERPSLLGREDALGQARTLEALYRSARLGVPVSL